MTWKRIWAGIRRRLKRQSVTQANKEWLLNHGLRIGSQVDCFSWDGMDFQYPGLITIGNQVTIAANVKLLAHDASIGYLTKATRVGVVEIGDHAFIGSGSTILPNVRIGEWSIVGAGSVVTRDIPPHSVAAGNPARVICTTEEFHARHEANMRTHYVSKKPWRAWANATPQEWEALRRQCGKTFAYVTQRDDVTGSSQL